MPRKVPCMVCVGHICTYFCYAVCITSHTLVHTVLTNSTKTNFMPKKLRAVLVNFESSENLNQWLVSSESQMSFYNKKRENNSWAPCQIYRLMRSSDSETVILLTGTTLIYPNIPINSYSQFPLSDSALWYIVSTESNQREAFPHSKLCNTPRSFLTLQAV